MPGRRVYNEPRRLVDHDEVWVFKHDVERDVLPAWHGIYSFGHVDTVNSAGFDPLTDVAYRPTLRTDRPRLYERLNAGTA